MHHYEFFGRALQQTFPESPTPFELQLRQSGLSPPCGSVEVEQG